MGYSKSTREAPRPVFFSGGVPIAKVAGPGWTDASVPGADSSLGGVRAPGVEPRAWLEAFPACAALDHHHIVHAGVHEAGDGSRIVHAPQAAAYFLACTGGRGRVLIDGRWRSCGEGSACLLPAQTLNACESIPGEPWDLCWVAYRQTPGQRPLAGIVAPVIALCDARPLRAAIDGLTREALGAAQPSLLHTWVDLIHAYVERFARPLGVPDQLGLLWERVSARLAEEWTLARLAEHAGYSNEHLRRLCRRQLGRSPMHQVTYLRMRRAAELLVSTEKTIDAICREVGYQNPFVFSNSFTKWAGRRPSEYRRKS